MILLGSNDLPSPALEDGSKKGVAREVLLSVWRAAVV